MHKTAHTNDGISLKLKVPGIICLFPLFSLAGAYTLHNSTLELPLPLDKGSPALVASSLACAIADAKMSLALFFLLCDSRSLFTELRKEFRFPGPVATWTTFFTFSTMP